MSEMLQTLGLPAFLATPIVAGIAAYFGAYLGKRAERRAIQDTIDEIERRIADVTEAARLRWSKRSEVCSSLYGKLMMAAREFRFYLSPGTRSTDEAVEQLAQRGKAFDNDFAQNALFLPRDIKERMEWMSAEFVRAFNRTTIMRPAIASLEPGQPEPSHQADARIKHYKDKVEELRRFKDGGDIASALSELEAKLRSALDLD